jgi:hypothetical protein
MRAVFKGAGCVPQRGRLVHAGGGGGWVLAGGGGGRDRKVRR